LDREALGALAAAIEEFQGGVVVISHNNEFVSTVCKEEWIMDAGHLSVKGDSGAWMENQDDKMQEMAQIEAVTDAFGNKVQIQQTKKLSKKELKVLIKQVKDKIKAGIDLDEQELQIAIENNL
jgi:elongation factor 3